MTNEKSVVFEYSQLVLTNPVKLNQATYMVNIVLPISKFPLSYWSSLLSLSAFLACYWWICFQLRSPPHMVGPGLILPRKKCTLTYTKLKEN
jgi:hypothetical protein